MGEVEKTMMDEDMGAYELITDVPINVHEIAERWECGEGKFWMVCIESDGGMMRFRGVFAPGGVLASGYALPWVRVLVDFNRVTNWNAVYINAPSGQHMSKLELAKEVQKELGGTLYKDGKKL